MINSGFNLLIYFLRRIYEFNGVWALDPILKLEINSILNIIADPHWGLPLLSLFKRQNIKKYFLKFFRKKDYSREDIAELFAFSELKKIFEQYFEINLNTRFAVKELVNGNKGLIWSNFHLKFLDYIKKLNLQNALVKIANDRYGFVNNFVTPTFYLILTKK